jgi:hypothetical protein
MQIEVIDRNKLIKTVKRRLEHKKKYVTSFLMQHYRGGVRGGRERN